MDSFGTQSYGKAMDCLKALREQCVKVSMLVRCVALCAFPIG